jgi:hypothetical protein
MVPKKKKICLHIGEYGQAHIENPKRQEIKKA